MVITLSINLFSLSTNQQLAKMQGMAEEYINLGINLVYFQRFYEKESVPFVFRPPGYPFFIGTVLRLWGGLPKRNQNHSIQKIEEHMRTAFMLVYVTQSILLSLSSAILFLWLSHFLDHKISMLTAISYGSNPYMIILTGLLHYSILHIFFVILSSYALMLALRDKVNLLKIMGAGILWGICTLVKAQTLILPAFIFILFLQKFKAHWAKTLKATVIFSIGISITILPYTIRNFYLTGRVIPINAQTGAILWAATSQQEIPDSNYYNWWDLWYADGLEIYRAVTKSSKFQYPTYIENNLALEDAFMEQAHKNFNEAPEIYFRNFFRNFISFNLDINSVFIKIFQAIQKPNHNIYIKKWLKLGDPQNFYPSTAEKAFKYLIYILTSFGFLGICLALKKKEANFLLPSIIYFIFCIAHSITYLDLMYYYIKIPFLFIFSAYFINSLRSYSLRLPFKNIRISLAMIFSVIIIIWIMGLNAAIL